MTTKSSRLDMVQNLVEMRVVEILNEMEQDPGMHTKSSYTPNTLKYPDHLMPFVDKHTNYLMDHPGTDINHYLTNLRLQIRVR